MSSSFSIGSVTAQHDVNMDSTVTNNITINYKEMAKEISALGVTDEEKQKMADLGQAVEKKDPGMISKVMSSISDNAPLLMGVCKVLAKVLF